ncbi:MAG: FapA family protein [Spirochaetales bacterium]|nr:FapA family protein [Spirochaetales bacterium]
MTGGEPWEEDREGNLFLTQCPESTEELKHLVEELISDRADLKSLEPSYYDSLVVYWRNKLLRYPVAVKKNQPIVHFYGIAFSLPLLFLEELKERFREIEQVCTGREKGADLPFLCHFVRKSTTVLSLVDPGSQPEQIKERLIFDRKTIVQVRGEQGLEYKARISGFLFYGSQGIFLLPPLLNTKNPYAITLRLIPIVTGVGELVDFCNAFLEGHREKYPQAPIKNQTLGEETVRGNGLYTYQEIDIVEGIKPIEGCDSVLRFFHESEESPDGADRIDHHTLSRINTVSQGDLIAVKTLVIPGRDGLDIFGKPLPVTKGKDTPVSIDDNIIVERFEKEFRYLARITGIVSFKNNSISLSETLVVKGDVDFHTGNISYEKNIQIKGDVRSGFSVDCRGALLVEGLVEDNVRINCQGPARICKGIIGEKTTLLIEDDLHCGFIERSDVRCRGNLTVERSVLGGQISVMGDTFIRGKGLAGKKIGVLSGTDFRSYRNIHVLSLGAKANKTRIHMGYNSLVEEKIKDVEKVIKGLQIRVSQYMDDLPLDLTAPSAMENLKRSDKATKEKVRKTLRKMKGANEEMDKLQKSRKDLWACRYDENQENTFLESKEGVKGDTEILYREERSPLDEKDGPVKVKFDKCEERFVQA